MELTSHQLVQTVMDSCAVNEIVLAEKLIDHTPGKPPATSGTGCCPSTRGRKEVAAVARNDRSPLADSYYQRQGAPSVDLDGRPDAFPWD